MSGAYGLHPGIDNPQGPGDYQHGVPVNTYPFGGYAKMPVFNQAFTQPLEFATTVIASFFSQNETISFLFPNIPTDHVQIRWEEYISVLTPFAPTAPQAPAPETYIARRAMEGSMQSFAQQFTLDNSIRGTKLQDLYSSEHARNIVSNMHLTVYAYVMNRLSEITSIYGLIWYMMQQRSGVAASLVSRIDAQLAAWSGLTGCINRRPAKVHALPYISMLAKKVIGVLSPWSGIKPDFMLMPEGLKEYLSLQTDQFDRPITAPMIDAVLSYVDAMVPGARDLDFARIMGPADLQHFEHMLVRFLGPIRTEDNPAYDVLEQTTTFGQFFLVDGTAKRVEILDYESQSWKVVFERKHAYGLQHGANDRDLGANAYFDGTVTAANRQAQYARDSDRHLLHVRGIPNHQHPIDANIPRMHATNVAGTNVGGNDVVLQGGGGNLVPFQYLPVYGAWYVIFRPYIQLRGHGMYIGVRGERTGVVFIGQVGGPTKYEAPDVRRNTTFMQMRVGFILLHPEHIARIPSVYFSDHVAGGGTRHALTDDVFAENPLGNGDLFTYEIPRMHNTAADIAHIDAVKSARFLNSRGYWLPPELHCLNEKPEFNWFPIAFATRIATAHGIAHARVGTGLRVDVPADIRHITDYGVDGAITELMARGRWRTTYAATAGGVEQLTTVDGPEEQGPLAPSDVASINQWRGGFPRDDRSTAQDAAFATQSSSARNPRVTRW